MPHNGTWRTSKGAYSPNLVEELFSEVRGSNLLSTLREISATAGRFGTNWTHAGERRHIRGEES